MAALSSGHLATDFANGAVPALLPFLVARFDLSYTLAGVVMLAWATSSSVVQPLFGLWSDRRGAIWLLPLGLALGGVALGFLAGLALPSTRVEDEKLGPISEEVKEKVKETGQEALEHGKQVAQEAASAATEAAKESGQQQAQELRGSAEEKAQSVRDTAKEQT